MSAAPEFNPIATYPNLLCQPPLTDRFCLGSGRSKRPRGEVRKGHEFACGEDMLKVGVEPEAAMNGDPLKVHLSRTGDAGLRPHTEIEPTPAHGYQSVSPRNRNSIGSLRYLGGVLQ